MVTMSSEHHNVRLREWATHTLVYFRWLRASMKVPDTMLRRLMRSPFFRDLKLGSSRYEGQLFRANLCQTAHWFHHRHCLKSEQSLCASVCTNLPLHTLEIHYLSK